MNTRIIKVDALARVEGEGALHVRLRGDEIEEVRFRIFEPPRFFEAFLRGRGYLEVPDITARICGICPVAYQMSSVHALEQALGLEMGDAYVDLRRLLYCGEWIESHALHVLMLHAPDFFKKASVLELAELFPEVVARGLALKKAGNALVAAVGGREVHPVNVRVGGFYRSPDTLHTLVPQLEKAREIAAELVEWVSGFDFPELEVDYEYVSLFHPDEYPMNRGRMVSNKGLDIAVEDFFEHFQEEHIEHSNALHCRRLPGLTSYQVGPLARVNLAFEQLSPAARELARQHGFEPPCLNPFKSIIARAVETFYAVDEALRLITSYQPPAQPYLTAPNRAGVGHACTEAPRGTLYHRYEVDAEGLIVKADIVPPTSQNQAQIEDDLRRLLPSLLERSEDEIQHRCEQAIRNYDPCISCATHFLRVELERL
ncbi:MAG: Ni/Fe hydrogenase subunit alpha [Vulcanimicrobiota bacterium]